MHMILQVVKMIDIAIANMNSNSNHIKGYPNLHVPGMNVHVEFEPNINGNVLGSALYS